MDEILVRLPAFGRQLGEARDEARIKRWRKAVGDHVMEGERVVDLETETCVINWETSVPGRITQLMAEKGDLLQADDPMYVLEPESEDTPDPVAQSRPWYARPERKRS